MGMCRLDAASISVDGMISSLVENVRCNKASRFSCNNFSFFWVVSDTRGFGGSGGGGVASRYIFASVTVTAFSVSSACHSVMSD